MDLKQVQFINVRKSKKYVEFLKGRGIIPLSRQDTKVFFDIEEVSPYERPAVMREVIHMGGTIKK